MNWNIDKQHWIYNLDKDKVWRIKTMYYGNNSLTIEDAVAQ
jgi:hypothetical protein